MFVENVFLFLWSLTIVGFFIKQYSYRMVPYIVAENPNIELWTPFACPDA